MYNSKSNDQSNWLMGLTIALVVVIIALIIGFIVMDRNIQSLQQDVATLSDKSNKQASTLDQHAQIIDTHTQELAQLDQNVQSTAAATQSLAGTVDYNANVQNQNSRGY